MSGGVFYKSVADSVCYKPRVVSRNVQEAYPIAGV